MNWFTIGLLSTPILFIGFVLLIKVTQNQKENNQTGPQGSNTGSGSKTTLLSKVSSSDVLGTVLQVVFSIVLGVLAIWLFVPEDTFVFLEKWGGSIGLFVITVIGFGLTKMEYLKNSTWTLRYVSALILFLGSGMLFLIKTF